MSPIAASLDEKRWQAVLERRRAGAQDGFVYAVTTTGIYCRPGCASRRPKRENVRFFETADAATDAGFRPCRRCHPDQSAARSHGPMIQRACRTIESADLEPTLRELAAEAGLSPYHFQRVFKASVGLSPKGYAKAVRAKRFKNALTGNAQVTGAIYEAGYGAPSRAYETAERRMGMSPARWRDGATGETISYACADCYLGRVVVAGTGRGICAIELGELDEELLEGLRSRFPKATLIAADAAFNHWLETVLSFIENPTAGLELPLDIRGTAFQERVWRALLEIDAGATVSYAELAERIGQPSAARAVATACAANKIAVAIPCHRVVRADGSLSGYRWGTARKKMLLEREAHGDAADA